MLTPKVCHPSEGKSQSYDIDKVREPLMATTSWGWVLSSRRKSVRASVQESDAAQSHKWFEVYKLLSAVWVGGVEWSWNSRQWWYRLEAVSWLRALGLDDGNQHLCLTFDLPSSPITAHPPATTISITWKLISTQFLLVSSQHTPASNSSCMCVRAGICVGVCVCTWNPEVSTVALCMFASQQHHNGVFGGSFTLRQSWWRLGFLFLSTEHCALGISATHPEVHLLHRPT